MRMLLLGAMLMTGCAGTPPPEDGIEPRSDPAFACNAEGLGDLIGRPASSEIGAEALRRSNARALRWIQPGDMVTMDYREDRLNIHLDASNRIERLNCG